MPLTGEPVRLSTPRREPRGATHIQNMAAKAPRRRKEEHFHEKEADAYFRNGCVDAIAGGGIVTGTDHRIQLDGFNHENENDERSDYGIGPGVGSRG